MDTPVYHLDGVVHTKAERENFDGPLDLILSLLSKNKMEIEEIQISLILDQYLAWMNQRQELDLEVASGFVTMAAHLVYIKTRVLLSMQDEEAISEIEALIASLEERRHSENYVKICQVTPLLKLRYAAGQDYIPKLPEPIKRDETASYKHQPGDLPRALGKLFRRAGEKAVPSTASFEGIVGREPYPVPEKAQEILSALLRSSVAQFRALFCNSKSRSEIVATFLAVLELCRRKRIYLAGSDWDCTVTRTEECALDDPQWETVKFD